MSGKKPPLLPRCSARAVQPLLRFASLVETRCRRCEQNRVPVASPTPSPCPVPTGPRLLRFCRFLQRRLRPRNLLRDSDKQRQITTRRRGANIGPRTNGRTARFCSQPDRPVRARKLLTAHRRMGIKWSGRERKCRPHRLTGRVRVLNRMRLNDADQMPECVLVY